MGWKRFLTIVVDQWAEDLFFCVIMKFLKMHLEIPKVYMEILEAWEDIRECRNMEGELINPIIFSNRNMLKG